MSKTAQGKREKIERVRKMLDDLDDKRFEFVVQNVLAMISETSELEDEEVDELMDITEGRY